MFEVSRKEHLCMFEIYVNQAGYLPEDRKVAVICQESAGFTVQDMQGNVCYEGKWNYFGPDALSGDTVWQGDFSAIKKPGRYVVRCEKGESATFLIGENAYGKLMYDVLRAFYYLRCGCALEKEHAGVYTHAACHTGIAVEWDNPSVKKHILGGWHDAGDYGRYVTPGAVALSHLMYAHMLYPAVFEKLKMNIPESGNSLPDILNECKWEMDWIVQMQREDGAVYHKHTTAHHAPFVMPEEDTAQLFLLPVSSMATADFCAICAQGYRVFKEYDKEYAAKLLAAAKKAHQWLKENPEFMGFKNPDGCGTGGYGQRDDLSNRWWAAAEMYAATGEAEYLKDAMVQFEALHFHLSLGWGDVAGLGVMALMTCQYPVSEAWMTALKKEVVEAAEKFVSIADGCGYNCAMVEQNYGWGSNMPLMQHGMILALADFVEGKGRFRNCMLDQLHVLMGVNAMGISYVTGNGDYAYNYPHLRPADADGIDACIPGMVSGGPNRRPSDGYAKELGLFPEGTPPMKCYYDDVRCYSLNEITIYWNSPVVFVLAAALNK